MQNRTNRLRMLSSALLVVTLAVAGCSSSNSSGSSTAPSSSPASTTAASASSAPKEPITLTVWMPVESQQLTYFNNLAEAPVAKELMKRTGVNLKFIHPPSGNEKEQFNVMVAARDLPDVVMGYFDGYKGGASQAVKDGLIIDPKDYIKDYAPNLTKILNADPDIGKLMKNDEGQFIGFGARVNNDVKRGQGMAYAGPMIRKDLLDKAGLAVPETIDEWYNVLKTFKTKFPDLQSPLGWSDMSESSYFIASAYDIPNKGWYLNGDKIAFANIQPNYKTYLETVNKWYKEGLIQKDFATDGYTDKVLPLVKTGKVAAAPMHLYWYGVIQPELPKDFEFVVAPQPALTKGQKLHIRVDSGWGVLMANTKYITTKNKYPKETIQFFDYLYSDEGKLLTNWGIEGESYKMVNGSPEFTEAYTKEIAKMGYLYTPNVLKERIDDRMNRMQYKLPIQQQGFDLWAKQSDTSMVLPPGLTFTSEEQAVNTKIMTDVDTYTKEMNLKFMMGVESLDKFDSYVKRIQDFGIDKVTANYNAAYERLKKR